MIEPVIVQIKDSLRTSLDLDPALEGLAALEKENGLSEVEWYAGPKLLVKVSFPKEFSDDQAQNAIAALQKSEAVEKVVVQSAANLEFKPADFERVWKAGNLIPDAARRGFDTERLKRPSVTYDQNTELPLHVTNEIIVRWKDEYVWNAERTGFDQQFASFIAQAECTVVGEQRYTDHDLTQTLEFDAVKYSVIDQLLLYQANEMVDFVQPNYLYELQSVPNDPFYSAYQKVYPLGKISAEAAWDITTGSDSTVVAVLDTGANVASTNGHVAHPDLTPNLWSGQNNGDRHNFTENGHAVTDVYDYESEPPPPYLGNSHGSNVASIIGAQGNNSLYMCGLSRNVALMILKVLPVPSSGNDINGKTSLIIEAVNYAVGNGAKAMNMSFGQYFCLHQSFEPDPPPGYWYCDSFGLDPALLIALQNARNNDVVAVAAAGNSGANNDSENPGPFGPANMPTDNLISVANSDANDARYSSSNFGVKTVDLAAPGTGIWGLRQTFNGNGSDPANYSTFYGTSQAAPHVTGTIALLKAKYGWETAHGLRDRVLMGTDDLTTWSTLVRTGGRLNANKALQARTLIRNVSTRARVESGDKIMIGGFIVGGSGTGTLKVAIRGLGPSLTGLSVAKLPNPKITLKNSSGGTIYSNNDWGTLPTSQKNDLAANGLTPTNSLEAAMVCAGSGGATGCDALAPGAYSVWLESSNGTSFGVGLFEIWELEGGLDEQTRLLNVSTRCLVRTGEEQAIAGLILGDSTQSTNTTIPKRSVLMFGKGPSLPITGKLANPFLVLKNSAGTQMSSNDSWSGATASVVKAADSSWTNKAAAVDEIIEAGLNPSSALCGTSPCESALWPILKSEIYTATLSGVSNGTGVGLIEIYEY
ncbi:MAG: S8 family serine peptidase [Chthoniobacterales bacterium]|nr:S8 family serine peptidase [Chthoniobacterales bacterium]